MNLLLDTHVVLWAFGEPDRLSHKVRDSIVDPRNGVFVSAATVWEVEIKRQLGKLDAPAGFAALCVERGFEELPISFIETREESIAVALTGNQATQCTCKRSPFRLLR